MNNDTLDIISKIFSKFSDYPSNQQLNVNYLHKNFFSDIPHLEFTKLVELLASYHLIDHTGNVTSTDRMYRINSAGIRVSVEYENFKVFYKSTILPEPIKPMTEIKLNALSVLLQLYYDEDAVLVYNESQPFLSTLDLETFVKYNKTLSGYGFIIEVKDSSFGRWPDGFKITKLGINTIDKYGSFREYCIQSKKPASSTVNDYSRTINVGDNFGSVAMGDITNSGSEQINYRSDLRNSETEQQSTPIKNPPAIRARIMKILSVYWWRIIIPLLILLAGLFIEYCFFDFKHLS